MSELSNVKQKERNLINSIEKLGNSINELDVLIGLSSKILRQLERTEMGGELMESGRESKPMDKPDIIAVIDLLCERINDATSRTGKNLNQVSTMIGV